VPNKQTSLENLADLSNWKFHDPARAIILYKRAIVIRESVFGQESEYTAPDYNYLAYIYTTQGKYPEAEKFYKQSIAGYKKVKNSTKLTNMQTSFALNGYSELLEKLGRTEEAKEMKKQAKKAKTQAH
jgi:tetratricopeptide (TPR) repeat protein